jgi:hypothetical protein
LKGLVGLQDGKEVRRRQRHDPQTPKREKRSSENGKQDKRWEMGEEET